MEPEVIIMAGIDYTSPSIVSNDILLNGGLNSTGGPLSLRDNESSDLQNVDFNKFGSAVKRNGYTTLNSSALTSSPDIDGLHWYEFNSSGVITRFAITVAGDKVYKMDALDGTWDDITGSLTITAGNHVDFENFLNEMYATNNADVPFKWTGSGNASAMTVPTGLTDAKFVKQFNNYLFLANVQVSGTRHASRLYWSNLKDTGTWTATDFIEVSKDDGQEISGLRVLGDRLVVFKQRSIYNIFFTGDPDIPFVLPGGGKANSEVGCVAPFSIQDVENGLVFLSSDGFYYYDGLNSFRISDKITSVIIGYNTQGFGEAVSVNQKNKNRYWCAIQSSGQNENDKVLVWDYFNNAWSVYDNIDICSLAIFYVNGIEERLYFGDYSGFVYRGDTGTNDNPLGVATAIDAYYWTNWRPFGDLVSHKGVPTMAIYFQNSNSVLTFAYSYDFESGEQYSHTINLATSSDVYGVGKYGTARYAGAGGDVTRRDLIGRGRVVRFRFRNAVLGETFQIDGFGAMVHLETQVG